MESMHKSICAYACLWVYYRWTDVRVCLYDRCVCCCNDQTGREAGVLQRYLTVCNAYSHKRREVPPYKTCGRLLFLMVSSGLCGYRAGSTCVSLVRGGNLVLYKFEDAYSLEVVCIQTPFKRKTIQRSYSCCLDASLKTFLSCRGVKG